MAVLSKEETEFYQQRMQETFDDWMVSLCLDKYLAVVPMDSYVNKQKMNIKICSTGGQFYNWLKNNFISNLTDLKQGKYEQINLSG